MSDPTVIMNARGWLTVDQAAQANRVSVRTIRRWMRDGIEVMHVDGRAYVDAMGVLARGTAVS
jgi:hypothetical protein